MAVRILQVLSACAVGLAGCGLAACGQGAVKGDTTEGPHVAAATAIEAGRYLVMTSGCNDCHTPGYAQSGGKVPEPEWLKGSDLGFMGPWGTTYPNNLRRTAASMTEDAWVEMLSTREESAPMPWPSVRAMAEADKRAVYRYIKSLPLEGDLAPTALPPGQTPVTPYENMMPVMPGPPPA